jgi:NADPH-dependent 7-cyano-7-deazaguanine reductase QueF-like protein
MTLPEHSPLGKPSAYKTEYDASLLFPIPRQPKRAEIGLPEGRALPFFGVDIWNAYEVSWLNLKGKPQVALATFIIPADTPNIVESKSFKLYLNSFNQTKIASPEALQQLLHHDLSEATGGTVQVRLVTEADLGTQKMGELDGCCWTGSTSRPISTNPIRRCCRPSRKSRRWRKRWCRTCSSRTAWSPASRTGAACRSATWARRSIRKACSST